MWRYATWGGVNDQEHDPWRRIRGVKIGLYIHCFSSDPVQLVNEGSVGLLSNQHDAETNEKHNQ